jgi:hypothetical protein
LKQKWKDLAPELNLGYPIRLLKMLSLEAKEVAEKHSGFARAQL